MVDSAPRVQTVPPRRKRRWLPVLGAALALVLGAAFALLRWKFEGAELGDNIASILNKRMRGRIAIGAVEWSSSSLATAITGGWIPLTLRATGATSAKPSISVRLR